MLIFLLLAINAARRVHELIGVTRHLPLFNMHDLMRECLENTLDAVPDKDAWSAEQAWHARNALKAQNLQTRTASSQ